MNNTNIPFYKYHGTGNDFIIIDNRSLTIILSKSQIQALCHRRFGIGADGLILLQNSDVSDFEMVYYNADGGLSTMCGNGGRCIAKFAKDLGIVNSHLSFMAIDGLHSAHIDQKGTVSLKMQSVEKIEKRNDFYCLDTGSPHYVCFVEQLESIDVLKEGRAVRYNERFKKAGINVNFVQVDQEECLSVATYERGVEAETYSCGTGVVASAIAYYYEYKPNLTTIPITTLGGKLVVSFEPAKDIITNVWLKGAATFVYKGSINLECL